MKLKLFQPKWIFLFLIGFCAILVLTPGLLGKMYESATRLGIGIERPQYELDVGHPEGKGASIFVRRGLRRHGIGLGGPGGDKYVSQIFVVRDNKRYDAIWISNQESTLGRVSVRGRDLAEQFKVRCMTATESDVLKMEVKPGMVVCIDTVNPGELVVSRKAYDYTVAGIISGAGDIKTALVMNGTEKMVEGNHPVALTGNVYCLADASNAPIEPGDLLTTSDTPGHAMKVTDYTRAQGAVLGKAMSTLKKGRGLVLVLVTLQ